MIRLMETAESGDDLGATFLADGTYMVHGDDLEGMHLISYWGYTEAVECIYFPL